MSQSSAIFGPLQPEGFSDTSVLGYPAIRPEITSLYLVYTNRCNLTCKHCCVWSSPRGSYGLELSVAIRVINEARSLYGNIRLILGGGEPLLRLDDTLEILRHSRVQGNNTLLLTNGMLITARVASRLTEIDGLRIRMSLDGTSPERHDFVRGRDSFARTIKGIIHLRESGYEFKNLEIGCTIYPGWEDEMENILHFCEEHGIPSIKLKALSKLGRATEFWSSIPINAPDKDTLVYRDKLKSGLYEAYKDKWRTIENNDFAFGELNIYYDGNVYAYSFMGDDDQRNAYLGNIHHLSIEEIMQGDAFPKAIVNKFLARATGPGRSLKCLNITRV